MIGTPRVHYRVCDSTNRIARDLALAGAPHGTLVTADEQTAGRGRRSRSWLASPKSAVLMSVLLRGHASQRPLISLAAACGACEALEREAPLDCAVKWPNDLLVSGRKIAGILLEGRPHEGWTVLGLGLNVSSTQDELAQSLLRAATSMRIEAPSRSVTVAALTAELVDALSRWLEHSDDEILAGWRARDWLYERRVRWADGEGIAKGISDSGSLLVDTGSSQITLDAGDVHLAT